MNMKTLQWLLTIQAIFSAVSVANTKHKGDRAVWQVELVGPCRPDCTQKTMLTKVCPAEVNCETMISSQRCTGEACVAAESTVSSDSELNLTTVALSIGGVSLFLLAICAVVLFRMKQKNESVNKRRKSFTPDAEPVPIPFKTLVENIDEIEPIPDIGKPFEERHDSSPVKDLDIHHFVGETSAKSLKISTLAVQEGLDNLGFSDDSYEDLAKPSIGFLTVDGEEKKGEKDGGKSDEKKENDKKDSDKNVSDENNIKDSDEKDKKDSDENDKTEENDPSA